MIRIIPDITTAALIGQCVLYALNVVLFIGVVRSLLMDSGRSRHWIALLAGLVFALNPALLLLHQYALSEALFITSMLTTLLLVLRFAKTASKLCFVFAALAAGCLPIVRYAGLPFLAVSAAFIFALWEPRLRVLIGRWVDSLAFLFISILPLLCWLLLNSLVRGESTNRTLIYHPIETTKFIQLGETVLEWFRPQGPQWLALLLLVCTVLIVVLSFRRLPSWDHRLRAAIGLLCSAVAYVAFLLLSLSLLDAYTPLDRRILLPAWILLAIIPSLSLQVALHYRRLLAIQAVTLALIFLGYVTTTVDQVAHSRAFGFGYQTPGAAHSVLLKLVRNSDKRVLYTNAADYVFIHTGLELQDLPMIYNPNTREKNQDFVPQMAAILREMDHGEAGIVHFSRLSNRDYFPSGTQLEEGYSLNPTLVTEDGSYYDQLHSANTGTRDAVR
ncbi:MAG: hypothetical protein AAGA91_06200 [Pseudomonadota bacterium]